jgi:hypothetical protein
LKITWTTGSIRWIGKKTTRSVSGSGFKVQRLQLSETANISIEFWRTRLHPLGEYRLSAHKGGLLLMGVGCKLISPER